MEYLYKTYLLQLHWSHDGKLIEKPIITVVYWEPSTMPGQHTDLKGILIVCSVHTKGELIILTVAAGDS